MRHLENIVVDEEVVAEESSLVFHVTEETSDQRSNCCSALFMRRSVKLTMDDLSGLVLLEDLARGFKVTCHELRYTQWAKYKPQVTILGAQVNIFLTRLSSKLGTFRLRVDNVLDSFADETRASGNEYS